MNNKVFFFTFLISIGILCGFLLVCNPAALFFIILTLIVCGLIYCKSDTKERKFLLIIFILAILSRIILSFVYYKTSLARGYGVDYLGDAVNYSNNALYIAEVITKHDYSQYLNQDPYLLENLRIAREIFNNQLPPFYTYQIGPYSYYIAFLYTIFGYAPFLVKLLNCLFGSLLCLAVYSITKELFNVKAGRIAMAMSAFFPSLFFWSITSLRDILLILAIVFLFWTLMRFQNKSKLIYILFFIFSLAIIGNFKRGIVAILAPAVFIPIFLDKFKVLGKSIICFLVISLLCVSFCSNSRFGSPINKQLQELRPQTLIREQVVNSHRARSGYEIYPERFYLGFIYSLPDKDIEQVHPEEFLFGMVLGAAYFLFSPFVWHISSISELVTYPQMIIWYFLLACSIVGFFTALRYKRNKVLGIMIFCGLMLILNSLIEGNRGTMFRHRDMLTPFLLIFASQGICRLAGLAEESK